MTYTPETMRGWLETCDLLGEDPIVPKDDVLAAVAAWEKDMIAWCDTTVERDVLRKRLEAADVAMLDAAVKLRDYETSDDELDKVADRLAALAAGERCPECDRPLTGSRCEHCNGDGYTFEQGE